MGKLTKEEKVGMWSLVKSKLFSKEKENPQSIDEEIDETSTTETQTTIDPPNPPPVDPD